MIRRFVRDLDIPVPIVGVPTVRESDGLAMSSRNSYLTAGERARAPALYQALIAAAARLEAGEADAATILAGARDRILAAGFPRVDYVELRDADSLAPVSSLAQPARLLAAAWLGKARLIDNIPVPLPPV